MVDEFNTNKMTLRVSAPLTTISTAYLVSIHNDLAADLFGKPGPREPQPVMAAAIEYTLLRRAYQDNPLALAILDLHQPELTSYGWTYCEGCDAGIEEAADWPCRTVDLLWKVSDAGRPAVG